MEGETLEHVRLTSSQLNGDGDRSRLETDLGRLAGVRNVVADPDSHTVNVEFDPRVINLDRILEVMQAAGYSVQSKDFAATRDNPAPDRSQSGSS